MEDSNKYYHSRHFLRLLHRYEKAISEGHVPYMEADELTDIAEYYMTGKQDAKANQAIKAAIADYYVRQGIDPTPIVGEISKCDHGENGTCAHCQ